jgi:hypothetical protein
MIGFYICKKVLCTLFYVRVKSVFQFLYFVITDFNLGGVDIECHWWLLYLRYHTFVKSILFFFITSIIVIPDLYYCFDFIIF